MNVYDFMVANPWLALALAIMGYCLGQSLLWFLGWPFRIANRMIRHKNIVAMGWPPPHCDADGDIVAPNPAAEE